MNYSMTNGAPRIVKYIPNAKSLDHTINKEALTMLSLRPTESA